MTTRKQPHDPHEAEGSSETVEAPDSRVVTSMETKIAELESELAEARDRRLRLAADFDNFKKRTRSIDGRFATIDYTETPPLLFLGEFVEFESLRLVNLKEFEGWTA